MEKKKIVIDDHFYGRIFLALAIILIVLIPVIMCIILQVLPNFLVILQCIFPLITFIIGGFADYWAAELSFKHGFPAVVFARVHRAAGSALLAEGGQNVVVG